MNTGYMGVICNLLSTFLKVLNDLKNNIRKKKEKRNEQPMKFTTVTSCGWVRCLRGHFRCWDLAFSHEAYSAVLLWGRSHCAHMPLSFS